MTEEKIIDGVNINNCDLYCSRGYCTDDNISPIACKDRPDCYYKQLKRLEKENKELSFAVEKCLENAGIECDDEEQALRSLPMLGDAHYKVLVEKEALEQENKQMKSALEEIREYVTRHPAPRKDVVINKINEVLGNG